MASSNESNRRARKERLDAGLCSIAGCATPPEPGKSKCRPHLDLAAATARKRTEKCIAAGLCSRCKQRPPLPDGHYCQECLDDCAVRNAANYKKDKSKQRVRSLRSYHKQKNKPK